MNERLQLEVLHTERQLVSSIGALRQALQFDQPQTWTMAMLRRRWPSLEAEAIAQVARDRVGYTGTTSGMVLLLDEVVACDAVIGERMRAQRATTTVLRRVG